jgi:DNA polymerase zeta
MKFESRDGKTPEFEAKGIETVRRDQCALTQKVLKNSLIMLFRHGISAVKDYLYRQWSLILAGRLPVSDFIITGRVRNKYRGGRIGPVQAALFRRLAEADPGRVMRNKERISYVIVATPGASYRLKDCVLTPMELLAQWDSYTLHSSYYIVKHVNAALERCLGLAPHFIKINDWYEACPKPRRRIHFWPVTRTGSSSMISAYFGSDICSLCGTKCMAQGRARAVVCAICRQDEVKVVVAASKKLQEVQEEALAAAKVCSSCNSCFEDASTFAPERVDHHETGGGRQEGVAVPIAACTCIDCPNTYKRHRLKEECLEMEEICKALEIL